MANFEKICEYLGVTPLQFFDDSSDSPALLNTAIEGLRKLDEKDLMLVVQFIQRFAED